MGTMVKKTCMSSNTAGGGEGWVVLFEFYYSIVNLFCLPCIGLIFRGEETTEGCQWEPVWNRYAEVSCSDQVPNPYSASQLVNVQFHSQGIVN